VTYDVGAGSCAKWVVYPFHPERLMKLCFVVMDIKEHLIQITGFLYFFSSMAV